MKYPVGRCSLLGLVLALGSGCADDTQGIQISGNYPPDPGTCGPTMSSTTIVGRGILDIGLANALNQGYFMFPRVINTLQTRPSPAPPTATTGQETNAVTLVGFDVDVVPDPGQPITDALPAGVPGMTSLTTPYYGGVLAPGGAVTGAVEAIPANAAALLLSKGVILPGPSAAQSPYQTLTVHLRARTQREESIIFSNWISFPVSVCAYCLPTIPAMGSLSAFDPSTGSLLACPAAGVTGATSTCFPEQDKPSACCLSKRQILCGANIPAPTGTGMMPGG